MSKDAAPKLYRFKHVNTDVDFLNVHAVRAAVRCSVGTALTRRPLTAPALHLLPPDWNLINLPSRRPLPVPSRFDPRSVADALRRLPTSLRHLGLEGGPHRADPRGRQAPQTGWRKRWSVCAVGCTGVKRRALTSRGQCTTSSRTRCTTMRSRTGSSRRCASGSGRKRRAGWGPGLRNEDLVSHEAPLGVRLRDWILSRRARRVGDLISRRPKASSESRRVGDADTLGVTGDTASDGLQATSALLHHLALFQLPPHHHQQQLCLRSSGPCRSVTSPSSIVSPSLRSRGCERKRT